MQNYSDKVQNNSYLSHTGLRLKIEIIWTPKSLFEMFNTNIHYFNTSRNDGTLTHLLGQQVNILFVPSFGGIVELYQCQCLDRSTHTNAAMHKAEQAKHMRQYKWDKLIHSSTWVVAVIERTKVGTVEQLRFSRRPWTGGKKQNKNNNTRLEYKSKIHMQARAFV